MALPGNGTILATSADRKPLYERRVEADRRDGQGRSAKLGAGPRPAAPRDRHAAAFDNAMILDMAMGGSTNTVLHILAIAHEAGVPFTLERIDELEPQDAEHLQGRARRAAITSRTSPAPAASTRSSARSPAAARACSTSTCPTVTGKTLGENIAEYDIRSRQDGRAGPTAEPRPPRRRADDAGLDGAERRRRRARPVAALDVLEAEGEESGTPGSNGHGGDGFDPFDVIRDRRERLFAGGRPDDPLRQPRARRRRREDGRGRPEDAQAHRARP